MVIIETHIFLKSLELPYALRSGTAPFGEWLDDLCASSNFSWCDLVTLWNPSNPVLALRKSACSRMSKFQRLEWIFGIDSR